MSGYAPVVLYGRACTTSRTARPAGRGVEHNVGLVSGVIDDAQWADRASADALVFATRRLLAGPRAAGAHFEQALELHLRAALDIFERLGAAPWEARLDIASRAELMRMNFDTSV